MSDYTVLVHPVLYLQSHRYNETSLFPVPYTRQTPLLLLLKLSLEYLTLSDLYIYKMNLSLYLSRFLESLPFPHNLYSHRSP